MNDIQQSHIFRYCPRCGAALVAQKDNSHKCAACNFHFYINSAAAVAGIITSPEGKILLTLRGIEPKKGTYDLPGGFISPLESAENALVREIKEELNLDLIRLEYFMTVPNTYDFSGMTVFTTDIIFLCTAASLEGIAASDDVAGYVFIAPDEINPGTLGFDSAKKVIEKYRDYLKK